MPLHATSVTRELVYAAPVAQRSRCCTKAAHTLARQTCLKAIKPAAKTPAVAIAPAHAYKVPYHPVQGIQGVLPRAAQVGRRETYQQARADCASSPARRPGRPGPDTTCPGARPAPSPPPPTAPAVTRARRPQQRRPGRRTARRHAGASPGLPAPAAGLAPGPGLLRSLTPAGLGCGGGRGCGGGGRRCGAVGRGAASRTVAPLLSLLLLLLLQDTPLYSPCPSPTLMRTRPVVGRQSSDQPNWLEQM